MFSFAVPNVEKQSDLVNMPVPVRECYDVSLMGLHSKRDGKLILEVQQLEMCNHMEFYSSDCFKWFYNTLNFWCRDIKTTMYRCGNTSLFWKVMKYRVNQWSVSLWYGRATLLWQMALNKFSAIIMEKVTLFYNYPFNQSCRIIILPKNLFLNTNFII